MDAMSTPRTRCHYFLGRGGYNTFLLVTLLVAFIAPVVSREDSPPVDCSESLPPCDRTCQTDTSYPAGFFTGDGTPIPRITYKCNVNHTQPCSVNIPHVTESHWDSNQTINIYVAIKCTPGLRITFQNYQEETRKNILSFLYAEDCSIYWKDLANFGAWTDMKSVYLINWKDEFAAEEPEYFECVQLDENNHNVVENFRDDNYVVTMAPPRESSDDPSDDTCAGQARELPVIEPLETMGSLGIVNSNPAPLSPILSNCSWPWMADIKFINVLASPEELNCLEYSMPRLQAIQLVGASLPGSSPIPDFPWGPEMLELPNNLSRSSFLNDHYGTSPGLELPTNIYRRIFTFEHFHIGNLTGVSLKGNLIWVAMTGCSITEVGADTFNQLVGLQVLDLTDNMLTTVPESMLQGLESLHTVILKDNRLAGVPQFFFQNMNTLKTILLDGNCLTELGELVFQDLESAEVISISYNKLVTVSNDAAGANPVELKLQKLASVDFSNNLLIEIPTWLFYTRYLANINLVNNSLTSEGFERTLEQLNGNLIGYGSGLSAGSELNFFQPIIDKRVDMRDNPIQHLNLSAYSEPMTLNFKYLLNYFEMDFQSTKLSCDCHMYDLYLYLRDLHGKTVDYSVVGVKEENFHTIICNTPDLVRNDPLVGVAPTTFYCPVPLPLCPLYCTCYVRTVDRVVLVDCVGRNLTSLPDHVPHNTIELRMRDNQLTEITSSIPQYVRHLENLDLSRNQIEDISGEFVHAIHDLNRVLLHENHLDTLPDEVEDLSKLVQLTLGENHYICDCNTLWLKHWIIYRQSQIQDVDDIVCASGRPQSTLMIDAADEDFVCDLDEGMISAAVLAVLVVLVLLVTILAYIYRGEIKVFLYTRFNWHPFDRSDDADVMNMDFDAFVSYSHHDSQWVCNELRPRLEDEKPAYRLCIHERDFMVGAAITENIASALNTSRRMILVLSKAFLKSHWCHLEFRQAHCKALEERTNYLILVLCEDVSCEDLDEDMRLYIKTNTYLNRDNGWFWEKLKYTMPQKPLLDLVKEAEMKEEQMKLVQQKV